MLTKHARPRDWLIKFWSVCPTVSTPPLLSTPPFVGLSVCLSAWGSELVQIFFTLYGVISELNVECSYALAHDLCGSCFLPLFGCGNASYDLCAHNLPAVSFDDVRCELRVNREHKKRRKIKQNETEIVLLFIYSSPAVCLPVCL